MKMFVSLDFRPNEQLIMKDEFDYDYIFLMRSAWHNVNEIDDKKWNRIYHSYVQRQCTSFCLNIFRTISIENNLKYMKNFIKNIFFTFNGFSWWHYLNDDSIKWKWKKWINYLKEKPVKG